jgi:hypothetical protein
VSLRKFFLQSNLILEKQMHPTVKETNKIVGRFYNSEVLIENFLFIFEENQALDISFL